MSWDGVRIQDGQSEIEAIIEFIKDDGLTCVAYSHDDDAGVYYLAIKDGDEVYAEIASTKSFKGEVEKGWLHIKFINEEVTPIYINPSDEVFAALMNTDKKYNNEWRELVRKSKRELKDSLKK